MLQFSLNKEPLIYDEKDKPWYNTKEGVAEAIKTLAGFNKLDKARHVAGYTHKKRMNDFFIFGRYWLDSVGNCLKATGTIPKELLPDMPDVLTREEYNSYIKTKLGKDLSVSYAFNGGDLPLPGLKCAHCGKTWTIENCHDTVVRNGTKVIPLVDFVGKTLGEVNKYYHKIDDALYRMEMHVIIRNDKNIDLSPKYPNPERDWEKSIVKNERGWIGYREGVNDDYVIRPGDEGYFHVWKYFHQDCNRAHLSRAKRRQFRKIFKKAGFKDIRMSSLPNEYCNCESCAPWFNVNTEFGTIKIGWRKRVINIDWSAMAETLKASGELPKKSILSLFENEEVTKGNTYIHAWRSAKATDYLGRIYRLLSAQS